MGIVLMVVLVGFVVFAFASGTCRINGRDDRES